MRRAAGIIFFTAWLLCGSCVDMMLDDWRACWIAVVALIVAIVSAAFLARHKDWNRPTGEEERGSPQGRVTNKSHVLIARKGRFE